MHWCAQISKFISKTSLTCLNPVFPVIMCPLLDDPENGRVTTPPPYPVNSSAVYACDSGFESRGGSIRRVCMADGAWSSNAPLCVSESNVYTLPYAATGQIYFCLVFSSFLLHS